MNNISTSGGLTKALKSTIRNIQIQCRGLPIIGVSKFLVFAIVTSENDDKIQVTTTISKTFKITIFKICHCTKNEVFQYGFLQ